MRTPNSGVSPFVVASLLFVFSGATSLVYEVLWLRELILIFGSTQFATSTVLSTFMAGLALGAYAAGRWMTGRQVRPLRVYGGLEIGIGIYALVVPTLFASLTPLYRWIWSLGASESFLVLSLIKFVGIAVVLLPPTVLMGASLPVLARQVADDPRRIGGKVGLLYAVNTFGAVLGVFVAGFLAIPGLGMSRTLWTTALANLLLGATAIFLGRRTRTVTVADDRVPAAAGTSSAQVRLVLLVFALSGFAALVLEVAWTRVLALVMGSSVYAFSLMLLAFLVGLAAGSAVFAALLRRRPTIRPATLLATLLVFAGLAAYATSFAFGALPRLFAGVFFAYHPGPNGLFAVQLLLGLLVMFPATFALGGVFPAVLQLHARGLDQVSGSVGTVYAANTTGTIVGAALAGFVLIPRLGVLATVILVAGLEVALGLVVGLAFATSAGRRRTLRLAGALTVAGVVISLTPAGARMLGLLRPSWDLRLMNSGVYMNLFDLEAGEGWTDFLKRVRENNDVVYAAEGYTASVFVGDQPEYRNRYLSVNGKIEASTTGDLETQLMCAHLPLLFHESPKDVLVVGLASGITVGSVATHPVQSIRVVEIEAAMIPAARLFADTNNNVLDDPRVTISVNDARNELEFSPRTYDVVISEPSNPWMTVASNLFTEEFFATAHARLRPGGVFSQWVQTYYLPPEDLRAIIGAFRTSFPHVLLFETIGGLDLLLIGSDGPLAFDLDRWDRRISELLVAMDLARIDVHDAIDAIGFFRMGAAQLDGLIAGAPRNTDDNARVEFSAPRSLGLDTATQNTTLLRRFESDALDHVRPPIADALERDRFRLRLAEALLEREAHDLAAACARSIESESLRVDADRIRTRAEAAAAFDNL